jgi:hypothetical protein
MRDCSACVLKRSVDRSCGSLWQIGFFAILAVEALANKGLLEMLGVGTGSGLPFEF